MVNMKNRISPFADMTKCKINIRLGIIGLSEDTRRGRRWPTFPGLFKGLSLFAGWLIALFANPAVAQSTTPQYVQGNYATPGTPQTSVTVPYTAAQKAGDLNVVIVGWSESTTRVRVVRDTYVNIYQPAIGPTVLD